MFLQSNSKSDPFVFFTFIKKKDGETWEKPSMGEGKSIKISLEELAMFQRLFNKTAKSWKGFHSFNGTKTSIELNWTGEDEIQMKVDQYLKPLKAGQIDVLGRLIRHLFQEKIEFATEGKPNQNGSNNERDGSANESIDFEADNTEVETNAAIAITVPKKTIKKSPNASKEPETTKISGVIVKTTEKAIQVRLELSEEKWFPKSRVRSEYDPMSQELQMFLVESWILKKKD